MDIFKFLIFLPAKFFISLFKKIFSAISKIRAFYSNKSGKNNPSLKLQKRPFLIVQKDIWIEN